MSHTSEKRWPEVSGKVSQISVETLDLMARAGELFNDMLEMWAFAGATDAGVAELLFRDDILGREELVPNASEIQRAVDLRDALLAINDLALVMNNQAVATENRAAKLRRMS